MQMLSQERAGVSYAVARREFSWAILLAFALVAFAQPGHADEFVYSCASGTSKRIILPGTVATCALVNATYAVVEEFEFSGKANETFVVLLTRRGSGIVCMQVRNPDGSLLVLQDRCTTSANPTNHVEITLPVAGIYNIRVFASQSASALFTLALERLTPPTTSATPIAAGQTRLGDINPAGDFDLYKFNASAGQVFSAQVSGPEDPCVTVFSPTGASLSGFCVAQASFTAPAAGTYTILVGAPQAQTTLYSLLLRCSSGCPPPPPLELSRCLLPRALQVSAALGSAPRTFFIRVGNGALPGCILAGSAAFTTEVELLNGQNWLSVGTAPGTFTPGDDLNNKVLVRVVPESLTAPGTYQALIRIIIPSLNTVLRVPVTLTLTSARPQLLLSWTSFVFQRVALSEDAASGPPSSQTLRLFNGVPGTIDWSVPTAGLPAWLSVTCQTTCTTTAAQIAGTAGSEPGQGSRLTIRVNSDDAAVRSPGVYTAQIEVRASNASNSPQYVSITYHAVQRTAAPAPLLTSYGLVFSATQGGQAPPSQTIVLSPAESASVQFSQITYSGGNWLSLSTSGAPSQGSVTVTVSVDSSSVPVGAHRAKIIATFTTAVAQEPQEADVILIVSSTAASPQRTDAPADGCVPASMQFVGTTIGNGLSTPVSFPQVLLTQVVDNCGQAVTGATAVATAEGLTISMPEVGGGFYSGTWTPQQAAASVPVSFAVLHPSFAPVQQSFTVSTVPGSGGAVLPVLLDSGVVEAAGFAPDRPLAPGSIIALFGSNLAPATSQATQIPLERSLAQTSVRIGGVNAPLYFVSPGQINAQVPYEAAPGDSVSIVVNANGRLTTPQTYPIAPAQPGIFLAGSDGIIIKFSNGQLVSAQNPARVNDLLVIYTASLGFTNPPVATGAASATAANAVVPVSVTIGGVPATISYAGLTPSLVGLYQVNVIVPAGVAPGAAVPVVVTQNGVPSNPLQSITIPIAP